MMREREIRVGSRESKLAVRQAELVMEQITAAHPEIRLELVTMKTTGDLILDRPLDKIGGKGLFVKELDQALLDGRIDISVHSLKDMPMVLPRELPIAAYSKRADPRDVLILPEGVRSPDPAKPLGCSSLRRALLLARLFPELRTQSVRGNLLTRLAKLDCGGYAGLVLAHAGILRLGLGARVSRVFSAEEILPAAGQGILAVQSRAGEELSFLDCVDEPSSRAAAAAERAFVRRLDGGCSAPIAAYARIGGTQLELTGLYDDGAGGGYRTGTIAGASADAEKLGERLAERLGGQR